MADTPEQITRAWLETFVVGLNLCPFARPFLADAALRVSVCEAHSVDALTRFFLEELDLIQSCDEQDIATALLVMPQALADFDDYLGFLQHAQSLLADTGLVGTLQLASFHPEYLFEGEPADGASHYSNRSPFPMIHLLREDMLTRVLGEDADPERIVQRNLATLTALGRDELVRRWRALFSGGSR